MATTLNLLIILTITETPTMNTMHHPAHPGEVLREYLPDNLSITDIAQRLGISRQALSALLNQRAGLSADMALRLEAALGIDAGFWMRIQTAHDLWQARQNTQAHNIPRIAA